MVRRSPFLQRTSAAFKTIPGAPISVLLARLVIHEVRVHTASFRLGRGVCFLFPAPRNVGLRLAGSGRDSSLRAKLFLLLR